MPIKFRCPSCEKTLGIATRKAGTVVSCPKCSYPATVPPRSTEPDDAPDGAAAEAALLEELTALPKPKKPIFERRDFERVINGPLRPPSNGSGARPSAVATVSAPPARPAADPLARAAAAELRKPIAPRAAGDRGMPMPFALGLAGAALVLGAAGGFMGGRATAPTPRAAETAKPAAPAAANAPPPAAEAAYRLRGTVQLERAGKRRPDAGARVLLFPQKRTPLRPFGIGGLKPADDGAADRAGLDGMERIAGYVATADAEGKYDIPIERPGGYWVLVVSRRSVRPAHVQFPADELATLAKYTSDFPGLVGDRQYRFLPRAFGDAEPAKKSDTYSSTFSEE